MNKLNDLHSNIINLLTNMPTICFEELMTPCITLNAQQQQQTSNPSHVVFSLTNPSDQQFKSVNNYYLNVRMAHNRKRISRRSKRIKHKQDSSSSTTILEDEEAHKMQQQQQQQLDTQQPPKATLKTLDNVDLADSLIAMNDEDVEFEGKNMEAIAMILGFMNRYVSTYVNQPTSANADALYPVLLLLSLMAKSNKIIRHYCRLKVLPALRKQDLLSLPQQGSQLRNKLARLMTDPNIQIKRLSAKFLFILCKESVRRLVKYTGFGNAAGLLAETGLMASTSQGSETTLYSSDSDESDTEDYKQLESCINPVTGRAYIGEDTAYFDPAAKKYVKLKKDMFEGMSEEQKEYEAMKLVNELDKLTRLSGVIKPATIGPDGRPVELEHVLQLQENSTNSGGSGTGSGPATKATMLKNNSVHEKSGTTDSSSSSPTTNTSASQKSDDKN
jgi:hypothetical protein